ncbi:MAG: glycosyltransferase [Planctomycetota bacterium]|jgi:glycosyltransferase involved in cell wall biosynthesis
MKLLVLTNNPKRASFRQRIAVHLDTLHTNGIDCEVAKLPRGSLARRKLFKQAGQFDGVFLQKKCLNFRDAIWLRRYSKKIIYDLDDAIMYSPRMPESNRSSHFRLFRRTAKLADMVIAGNSYLAEHAQKFNPNVKILPTGLKVSDYKIDCPPKNDDKTRLVWIGSESTLRYLVEIKSALEEIGSRFDNVVLRMICDEFFELQNIEMEKCWWSLQKQAVDLATSDIGLAPLPDNRFTRGKCGFKILQYEAANLPIVTSPVGVNAEYVHNGVTGYHAPDIPQWIDRISELIDNAKLRKQMAGAGKVQAERFDITITGKKLCSLITECIQGAPIAIKKVEYSGDQTEKLTHLQKNTPTVSICIPTYNRKDYLKETLDSILAQTYKDYEIVIVDDGSTDGTKDMIKQLGFPVTYYWQENSGDAAARNKLIELAHGQYISFIDSDDLLLSDAIEKMVQVMEAEIDDVIVYGSYLRIDQNGTVYGRCKRKLYTGNITKYLFQTILVHSCGSMLPRKILKDSIAFDTSLKVCSDYDLWLSLSTRYRFIALPEPTFKRRRHPGNLSNASFKNRLTQFKVLERFYYEKGGNKVVPPKIAMKVLSREGRRAGRCAIREGLYDRASQLLGQSFHRHPNLKSLIYWSGALSISRFR